jgi:HEAT repeat protein
MKNDPIETALARLDEIDPLDPAGRADLSKALSAKFNLVIAKAARIAGEACVTQVKDDLAAAFQRLLPRGAAADKRCAALTAIARALYALDYDDPELYRAGMKHFQLEASFGPPVDTAADLRAVCAMGLVNTRDPDKLRALVDMLTDPEWRARAGAVRALAVEGSDAAALLLRLKALTGDKETEVTADCFAGLLDVEGGVALPLIQQFSQSRNEAISEAAILSLGASRRPEAIEWLKTRFHEVAGAHARKSILLALASSRTEPAIEFLLEIIRNGSEQTSKASAAVMEIHRDEQLREQLAEALKARTRSV